MPYTVTIKIAGPGTALTDGGTSLPGHMWYSISDGKNPSDSYGFAPIKHGQMQGKGQVTADDNQYLATNYSRTMEITKAQYDKLKEFGDTAKAGNEKFTSLYYKDARHNCVDFTWGALNHAGLNTNHALPHALGMSAPNKNHEGSLKPMNNVDDVKRISAPFPKSLLNVERETPLAEDRTILQRLLSEEQKKGGEKPPALANTDGNSTKDVQAANGQAAQDIFNARVVENLRKNPEFLVQVTAVKNSRDISA